jgi:hypothetical protein
MPQAQRAMKALITDADEMRSIAERYNQTVCVSGPLRQ